MRTTIILLTILYSQLSNSDEQYGPYRADIIRVIDGDTVDVELHVYPGQKNSTRLRLAIIDTPELKAKSTCERKLAKEAKEFTTKFLTLGSAKVTIFGRGRYGRPLAKISINGTDLGEELLKEGLARKYISNKVDRKKWCKTPESGLPE